MNMVEINHWECNSLTLSQLYLIKNVIEHVTQSRKDKTSAFGIATIHTDSTVTNLSNIKSSIR